MTDFLKIAKSIVVHFAHICAYGVETVKTCSNSVCEIHVRKLICSCGHIVSQKKMGDRLQDTASMIKSYCPLWC